MYNVPSSKYIGRLHTDSNMTTHAHILLSYKIKEMLYIQKIRVREMIQQTIIKLYSKAKKTSPNVHIDGSLKYTEAFI